MVEDNPKLYNNPLHNPYVNREVVVEVGIPKKRQTKNNIFYTCSFCEAWRGWIYQDKCSLMLFFSGFSCCIIFIGIIFLIVWGITELLNPDN